MQLCTAVYLCLVCEPSMPPSRLWGPFHTVCFLSSCFCLSLCLVSHFKQLQFNLDDFSVFQKIISIKMSQVPVINLSIYFCRSNLWPLFHSLPRQLKVLTLSVHCEKNSCKYIILVNCSLKLCQKIFLSEMLVYDSNDCLLTSHMDWGIYNDWPLLISFQLSYGYISPVPGECSHTSTV